MDLETSKAINDKLWKELDRAENMKEDNFRYYEAYTDGLNRAIDLIERMEFKCQKTKKK